jgi:hypothetical protein
VSYEKNDLVTIRGLIYVYSTAKAIKVKFEGQEDDDGVWIAKSHLDSQSFSAYGEKGLVVIPFWIAEEKNLEGAISDEDGGHDDDDAPPL